MVWQEWLYYSYLLLLLMCTLEVKTMVCLNYTGAQEVS